MDKSAESFVSPLKVAELKDELKKRSLSPYGNKAVLQQRLLEFFHSEQPADASADEDEAPSTANDQPPVGHVDTLEQLADSTTEQQRGERDTSEEALPDPQQGEGANGGQQAAECDIVQQGDKSQLPDEDIVELTAEGTDDVGSSDQPTVESTTDMPTSPGEADPTTADVVTSPGEDIDMDPTTADVVTSPSEAVPSTADAVTSPGEDIDTVPSTTGMPTSPGEDIDTDPSTTDMATGLGEDINTDPDVVTSPGEDINADPFASDVVTSTGEETGAGQATGGDRKRPRSSGEDSGEEKQKDTEQVQFEVIDEYLAETEFEPPEDDSVIVLDRYNSDLYFNIQKDGLGGYGRSEKGFPYLWAGCRATWGCKDGRYCYEVKVGEYLDVELPPSDEHPHVVRVGYSEEDTSMNLGEVAQSYGYGATGRSSTAGVFNSYGEAFGPGDVIGCFVDLRSAQQTISFSKNGKHIGKCFVLNSDFRGKVLYPHITTKNVRITVNFGKECLFYEIPDDYQPLQSAEPEHLVRAATPPERKQDCEVIMMVGLPAAGKTKWAEKYAQEHPEKNYSILGTNLIMEKMRVPGLSRKRNYHGRWEQLIKQATEILNKLFVLASRQPRNYIIDQTNVYKNARARKIKYFEEFQCRAVVVIPEEVERKTRDVRRQRDEGVYIPEEAVRAMKANFTLPMTDGLFNEVEFVELSEKEAVELVNKYNEENAAPSPQAKRPRHDPPSVPRAPSRGGYHGNNGGGGGGSYNSRPYNRGPAQHNRRGSGGYYDNQPPYRESPSFRRDSYPSRAHSMHPPPPHPRGYNRQPMYREGGPPRPPQQHYDWYRPPHPQYDRPLPPQGGYPGDRYRGGHGAQYRPPPPPMHYSRRY